MAVFKPLILNKNEKDLNKIMKTLYRFSEDLKFTIANLSLEDNVDNSVLQAITSRNDRIREISFDADGFVIDFTNYSDKVNTRLEQTKDKISFLVSKGSVVETMLSRMELYGEYITLKTGQVVIDTKNMSLDKLGNVSFSGKIVGGSINIAGGFLVAPDGSCVIAGGLTTETLNPDGGISATELEIFNDDNYINNITGRIDCSDVYADSVACRRLYELSDQEKKREVHQITCEKAQEALQRILPVSYHFKQSGSYALGCIADELESRLPLTKEIQGHKIVAYNNMGARILPVSYHFKQSGSYALGCIADELESRLPLTKEIQGHKIVAYNNMGAVYAAAIQDNQRRIAYLKKELKEEWNVEF